MSFDAIQVPNQSQSMFVRALSVAWNNRFRLYDPSVWQMRDEEVEEKMLLDADIKAAVTKRKHLIAGNDWAYSPRDSTDLRGPMAVHVATELTKKIKHFTGALHNLARAFFSGSRFARIHGGPEVLTIGDGRARTWWVPRRLEDLDKRMFSIVPRSEKRDAYWEKWDVWDRQFRPESKADALMTIRHIYDDAQESLGYGSGLREACGWWWYAKAHVFQESLQAVSRFAQGIIHAKVRGARSAGTGQPNTEVIKAWISVLEDLRARHVLVSDIDDDVSVISGSAEGNALLKDIRQELRETLTTLILGANLPTLAAEGGSYALGDVQQDSTEMLVHYDRQTMQETISDDLVKCLWTKNCVNLRELDCAHHLPLFRVTQEKVQNPKERMEVAAIVNGMGVDLPLDDLLDQAGFRRAESGEDVVPGRAAPIAVPGADELFRGRR